ncbi:MAG: DUF4410 domain-containing protein [Steroidobacteraceae bacterium]
MIAAPIVGSIRSAFAAYWLFALAQLLLGPPMVFAANRTAEKQFAEVKPDEALVYLIREKRFVGGGRTMFVFADESFLGALDNDSYTFAYLPPGKHLLWLNWAKINTEVELEAGKTYYFAIWSSFDALDETSGQAYLQGIEAYATAESKEVEKSAEHIQERYGKALATAAKKPDDTTMATNLDRRAAHVSRWPKVDLSAHPELCVEPFVMADPKAADRKKDYLVESAPQRIAGLMLEELGTTAFSAVRQFPECSTSADTVVLRARITQYKPGSDTARFMLAGAGSAQIEMVVNLTDASSGSSLVDFEAKGTWAWGGALGAAVGISDIEKNVAYEVASYLKQARGVPLPAIEP